MNELVFTKKDGIKAIAYLSSLIDSLDDAKQYALTVKEHKKRRSMEANRYFWALCDQLAAKVGIAKTDLYKSYIREIGGNSDIVCAMNETVEKLCETWQKNGIGWIAETMPSKIDGCTNVVLYYGSSTYDTAQMSRLINLIAQDCKDYGIPTLEDIEMQRMLDAWGGG